VAGDRGVPPDVPQHRQGFGQGVGSAAFAALFAVGAVVKPTAGTLSDYVPRRTLTVSSLLLGAASLSAVVLAREPLFAVVAVVAFAAGLMSFPPVMQSYLMDSFPADSAGGDLGAMRTVYIGLGALGPTYVGTVATLADYRLAFWGLVAALLVCAGLVAATTCRVGSSARRSTASTPVTSSRAPPASLSPSLARQPWASAMSRTMARPRPVPVSLVVPRSKTSPPRWRSGTPGPSSATKNPSSVAPTVTVTAGSSSAAVATADPCSTELWKTFSRRLSLLVRVGADHAVADVDAERGRLGRDVLPGPLDDGRQRHVAHLGVLEAGAGQSQRPIDDVVHPVEGAADALEVRRVALRLGQVEVALGDAQRVPEVVADGVGDPLEALVLPVEFGALALQFGDVPEHHEAPGRVFADETRLHRQPPRLPARDDPHRVAALRFERASDGPGTTAWNVSPAEKSTPSSRRAAAL